jgi:3-hydroxyacyl-CoA dehydrogenase
MKREIKKVAVIGAGAMGSGIAAQIANAGVEVYLLDKNPAQPKAAIDRMLKASPASDAMNAGFMSPANAKRIKTGNTDDNLEEAVKDADWVVEVIIEDLGLKQKLFADIEKYRKPGSIVSSNTSTIPLHEMADGRSDDFKKNFVITHFFNPVRFMRLLEIVSGPATDADVTETMQDFCDVRLGKNVVISNDTPGFIANRLGGYLPMRAMVEAMNRKMSVEDVDALLGKPMGFPKDGIFGLLDLVGINIVPHVTGSLHKNLAADDGFQKVYSEPKLANGLLANGHWGRNAPNGGFYRMQKNADGSKQKLVIDLPKAAKMIESGEWDKTVMAKQPGALDALYRPAGKTSYQKAVAAGKKGPRAVFDAGGQGSDFTWAVMRDTLIYAASVMPGPTGSIVDFDAAMKDGYNWKYGPFEMLDKIGLDYFVKRATKDGVEIPPVLKMAAGRKFYSHVNGQPAVLNFDFTANKAEYKAIPRPAGILSLSDIKRGSKPILTGQSASLWDIGDGVACFEFHSKMNSIDPSIMKVLNDTIKMMSKPDSKYKALVIYNEESNFSVGANLGLAEIAMKFNRISVIEDIVYTGQRVYQALRYAPFPVIGAPNGMALGGGCEILLHCDAIQAGSETYMGLVESGVGLIPGWGGCARYLERAQDTQGKPKGLKNGTFPSVQTAFGAILAPMQAMSTSGQDAKSKLWLRPNDGVTMNKDRILGDAKAKAIAMTPGYKPPEPPKFRLPGSPGQSSLRMAVDDFYTKGDATWHDVVVGDALGEVLSGGNTDPAHEVTEAELLQKEREAFMSLVHTNQTQKRISHMLKTGKPLREEALKEFKTPMQIRENREPLTLPVKVYDGKPLSGKDERKLNLMARATWGLYKVMNLMG